MKKCIWCQKEEGEAEFLRKAHTIPQTLGGKDICINVCDPCNFMFGVHYYGLPPIETVLKETFGISRVMFLDSFGEVGGKNKTVDKYKSIFFNVDLINRSIRVKPKYKLNRSFQSDICRQLKRGLYKIFLEEFERQNEDGQNPKFDFIREFSRFNIGDLPVIYFERKYGAFYSANDWIRSPKFFIDPKGQSKYLVREPGFFEFELLGHVFGIATMRSWEIAFDNYIKHSVQAKSELFKGWKLIKNFDDVDFSLKIMAS